MRAFLFGPPGGMSVGRKLIEVNWSLIFLITLVSCIGFAMQYSAAGGSLEPWAGRQMVRFGFGLVIMLLLAVIDLRLFYRLAYPAYGVSLALLLAVAIAGTIGLGAQRWLDLGVIQLQPTELMKIALVLSLARYFNGLSWDEIGNPLRLIVPTLLVLAPAVLIFRQPDLGSALLITATGGVMFLAAGVRWWKFALVIAGIGGAIPVAWQFLREFQRQRIYTFLNPESDPLGAGYHIIQSKIALGSGGIWGQGYLQGTQSHLQFLPERQTDFIFTMLAEEFGMVGALVLIGLYVLILIYGLAIALRAQSQFARLIAIGVTCSFFLYAFINMAMVMGMIPVVGEPLPLVSYGGTAMMALQFAFGILINVYVHRDVRVGRVTGDG